MKTNMNYKVQTLIFGGLFFALGVAFVSTKTDALGVITTFIIILAGIACMIIGMYFLVEYAKIEFIPDSEEIDMMKDDEIEKMMEYIENMELLYFNHDPKIKLLYEELGEKMMDRYRLKNEIVDHIGV